MRRRDFLALSAASMFAPLTALAQQGPTPRRLWLIGALSGFSRVQSDTELIGPFRDGMAALGYVLGRDYALETRYSDGDVTRFPVLAKELIDLAPDLIVTFDGPATVVVQQTSRSVPIVVAAIPPDLVDGLVGKNLGHPVGNVTGIVGTGGSLPGKHCELAMELVPAATRIGVLTDPQRSDRGDTQQQVLAAAAAYKFTPTIVDVADQANIASAFRQLADAQCGVVVVGPGSFATDRARTVAAAAAARLPAIYNQPGYVEAGGLISYGAERRFSSRRIATFADAILKGAKPGELPAEQQPLGMAINLKTAKSLGLTIPPTVLFRADIVID